MSSKKFGKSVDIGRLLTDRSNLKQRIKNVGIELEGGWAASRPDIIHDGSVRNLQPPAGVRTLYSGEIPSPVLEISEWEKWIRDNYPQAVNETCGLHVHMSFAYSSLYSRCMDPRLPATIVDYVNQWAQRTALPQNHPIWPRLQNKSPYCQHVYSADLQILADKKDHNQTREGNRYTVLGFHYGRLGTMECRLLPMMESAELAVAAVKEVLDITNAYLVATATREKKLVTRQTLDVEGVSASRRIFV